jgi:hypothetical protein
MVQQGYFILVDISGFTTYLVGVELQHAKDIIGELLEYVAEHTSPLLVFEKFEGMPSLLIPLQKGLPVVRVYLS